MPGPRHDEQTIEKALIVCAIVGNNYNEASRRLEAEGIDINRSTIQRWAERERVARYTEIRKEVVPQIHAQMAQQAEANAQLAGEVEREVIEKLHENLEEIPPRDLASALRNISTTKGINVDKAALLRGVPTTVVEHRKSPEEILRKLERLGVIEGSATELPTKRLDDGTST